MACCAAAAFFLAQMALAFESVRRRLFGASPAKMPRNDAVLWTPGTAAARPTRRRRMHKLIVATLLAEAALVAGTAAAWTSLSAPDGAPAGAIGERDLWALAIDSICSSDSSAGSRGRLNNSIEGNVK